MNKKIIITVLSILALVAAAFAYLSMLPRSDTANQSPTIVGETGEGEPADTVAPSAGTYLTYRDGAIENTAGTKILFFHAPWCPQCRALETSIESGQIPASVTIFKVDYDSNQDLRQKYGVTIQTTLVKVDDDGSLIEKYVAYSTPTLQAIKDNLL